MLTLHIDDARLKEMAKRLRDELNRRGINTNHQSALQIISKAALGKPYEEIKALLESKNTSPTCGLPVTLAYYAEDAVLFLGEEVIAVSINDPITHDHDTPNLGKEELREKAKVLAQAQGTLLRTFHLPEVVEATLAPAEQDDYVALCKKMGELKIHPSIFECFALVDSGEKKLLIDNGVSMYSLNGDWMGELQNEMDSDQPDPDNVCIWMPEYHNEDGFHEYFISFGELCNATTYDEGRTWIIPTRQTYQNENGERETLTLEIEFV